jgi:hypothetical protein
LPPPGVNGSTYTAASANSEHGDGDLSARDMEALCAAAAEMQATRSVTPAYPSLDRLGLVCADGRVRTELNLATRDSLLACNQVGVEDATRAFAGVCVSARCRAWRRRRLLLLRGR